MKLGNDDRQAIDMCGQKPPASDKAIKLFGCGKALHSNSVFNCRLLAKYGDLRCTSDGNDIEIKLRRQSAVKPDFFFAIIATQCEAGKIQKAEVNRFFDFIRIASCQQHPGNMRFDQMHTFRRMGIAPRIQQGSDQPDLMIVMGLRRMRMGF